MWYKAPSGLVHGGRQGSRPFADQAAPAQGLGLPRALLPRASSSLPSPSSICSKSHFGEALLDQLLHPVPLPPFPAKQVPPPHVHHLPTSAQHHSCTYCICCRKGKAFSSFVPCHVSRAKRRPGTGACCSRNICWMKLPGRRSKPVAVALCTSRMRMHRLREGGNQRSASRKGHVCAQVSTHLRVPPTPTRSLPT